MENCSDIDPCQSFQSPAPPRRRRSTFFVARESLAPLPFTENKDPNTSQDQTDNDDKHHQELLMRYSAELLSEKDQWKKEVCDRRSKYHDLRQQYQLTVKASSRSRLTSSYSALTNEDIEFLKQKTNISKFLEMQQKLHSSVQQTITMYRRVNELDNEILTHSETQVRKVTQHILETSTIE